MRYTWGVLLLVSSLASAASSAASLSEPDAASVHRIAVVSSVGETFHGINIGITVFGNSAWDAPVPEWGVDAGVTDNILLVMKQRGRFPAEPLNLNGFKLPWLSRRSQDIDLPDDARQALLERARQQGADALLMVMRNSLGTLHRPGFGLVRRNQPGLAAHPCVYVLFGAVLFRVSDGKRISSQVERPCEFEANRTKPQFVWKDAWEQYNATEHGALEAAVKHELDAQTDLMLEEMKLVKN